MFRLNRSAWESCAKIGLRFPETPFSVGKCGNPIGYPALNAARKVFWLVTGEGKREALGRLLEGDRSIPAARVAADDMMVVADEAAAGTSEGS